MVESREESNGMGEKCESVKWKRVVGVCDGNLLQHMTVTRRGRGTLGRLVEWKCWLRWRV